MSEPLNAHKEFDALWLDYREARGALRQLLESALLARGGMEGGWSDDAIERAQAIVGRKDKATALIEAGYDLDRRAQPSQPEKGEKEA